MKASGAAVFSAGCRTPRGRWDPMAAATAERVGLTQHGKRAPPAPAASLFAACPQPLLGTRVRSREYSRSGREGTKAGSADGTRGTRSRSRSRSSPQPRQQRGLCPALPSCAGARPTFRLPGHPRGEGGTAPRLAWRWQADGGSARLLPGKARALYHC